jgi:hypothetical protein
MREIMKDNLEKFVGKHREKFDDELPPGDLFSRIEQNIPNLQEQKTPKRRLMYHPLAYAASLILVAGLAWLISMNLSSRNYVFQTARNENSFNLQIQNTNVHTDTVYIANNSANQVIAETTPQLSEDELMFAEISDYYKAEIQKRRDALYNVSSNDPDILFQVEEELALIDTLNAHSQRDLYDNVNVATVMEEMIENYRQSIDILDMMLDQLTEEYAFSKSN